MTEQAVQPPSTSEIGRLAGVFWEPKPVFEDLAARPHFWIPLILLAALATLYVAAFSRVVGWESLFDQRMAANSQMQQMSAEQREQALGMVAKIVPVAATVGAPIGEAAMLLLIAAVMLGSFNLLGGADLKYRQVLSITCYASLPKGLWTILAMVVLFLKDPADFDLKMPLPLNLAAFLTRSSTPAWLYALAGSMDLFSFWIMLLMALGFSVAARKMEFGKSLTLVLLPWALLVILGCALAAMGLSGGTVR